MIVTEACIMLCVVSPDDALHPQVLFANIARYYIAAHVASMCNTLSVSACAIMYLKLIPLSENTNTTHTKMTLPA